jgi:hypothetical protein
MMRSPSRPSPLADAVARDSPASFAPCGAYVCDGGHTSPRTFVDGSGAGRRRRGQASLGPVRLVLKPVGRVPGGHRLRPPRRPAEESGRTAGSPGWRCSRRRSGGHNDRSGAQSFGMSKRARPSQHRRPAAPAAPRPAPRRQPEILLPDQTSPARSTRTSPRSPKRSARALTFSRPSAPPRPSRNSRSATASASATTPRHATPPARRSRHRHGPRRSSGHRLRAPPGRTLQDRGDLLAAPRSRPASATRPMTSPIAETTGSQSHHRHPATALGRTDRRDRRGVRRGSAGAVSRRRARRRRVGAVGAWRRRAVPRSWSRRRRRSGCAGVAPA